MKSIGVIRKIDDLGRLVIPKQIRNNLKIKEGEELEIFTYKDSIIVKKSSSVEETIEFAKQLCSIINNITRYELNVTDEIHILSDYREDFRSLEKELNKLIFNK